MSPFSSTGYHLPSLALATFTVLPSGVVVVVLA